jgi:ABC-type multidrug transport system ATPase subunit
VHRKLAIAHATLKNARALLLDEPTHGLDASDIEPLITSLRLIRKGGAAILLATRDLAFAQRVAARVVHLEHGAIIETSDLTTSRRAFHADSYLSHLVS